MELRIGKSEMKNSFCLLQTKSRLSSSWFLQVSRAGGRTALAFALWPSLRAMSRFPSAHSQAFSHCWDSATRKGQAPFFPQCAQTSVQVERGPPVLKQCDFFKKNFSQVTIGFQVPIIGGRLVALYRHHYTQTEPSPPLWSQLVIMHQRAGACPSFFLLPSFCSLAHHASN